MRPFVDLLDSVGLVQHVLTATQTHSHTLDPVIAPADDPILLDIRVGRALLSGHFPVVCTLGLASAKQRTGLLNFRKFRRIDKTVFAPDITERPALLTQKTADAFALYNEVVEERIDQHAPVLTHRTW